ncbi:MAG: transposase [Bacteroidales bacterium]|nr:transposase [Bacteroidales bacterium]
MAIAHRIELKPNNKQKTYFRKAFGCARLAYNWGLAEWKRMYEAGEKANGREIRKRFNAIKKEQFPFVYEVTKCASDQPFANLQSAFDKFFKDLKQGTVSYPQFKKKRDNEGSFYLQSSEIRLSETNKNSKAFAKLTHNELGKHQYIHMPNLEGGWVKMAEHIRFNYAKINNVCISQCGGKFYASFSLEITEDEYKRTHPNVDLVVANRKVGVDVGIKSALILSDGIAIDNPKPLKNNLRRIKRLSRQLSKRVHPKTKEERLKGIKKSNNYMKLSVRLASAQGRVANIRRDFLHKVTTILTTHYGEIAIEDLNVKGMTMNHRLAQAINDVSFGEMRRQIEYKAATNGVKVLKADRYFASSKTCSVCGVKKDGLTLADRTFRCEHCGAVLDRDYNASRNLLKLLGNQKIGMDDPESTPTDLTALLSRFSINGIATSKVETGKQHKFI